MKRFTTKLNAKSKWDKGTVSNLNSNPIHCYPYDSKTAEETEIGIYGSRTQHFESLGIYPSILQGEIGARY